MLQRSVECMEAKRFLDLAAETTDLELQAAYIIFRNKHQIFIKVFDFLSKFCHVAMFNASTFLRISDRLKKPFNPMLGETFELDLWDEPEQMRIITEQVTHHPPMSAIHVESKNGWVFESTIAAQSRFKLTAMAIDVTVGGAAIVTFENNDYSYCIG